MGKDKKKDPERKLALQAQKAQKAEKKAAKRLLKESLREGAGTAGADELDDDNSSSSSQPVTLKGSLQNNNLPIKPSYDDIDAFLEAYQKQNLENTHVIIQPLDDPEKPFPFPPRGNATFTAVPTTGEIVLFGGEYNNGVQNIVFDELFRWDPDMKGPHKIKDHSSLKSLGMWKRIITPAPRPNPRCSHSCVYHDHALYMFGGEYAMVDKYHHYRDLWKLELKTNTWTELKPKGNGPSARSGHRVLVWRHYMILFGGFFEAQETRWFNDLYAYDFSSNTWSEFIYSKFAILPPERSAFNFGLCPGNADIAFVCGGFSKLKAANPSIDAETRVYSDCWALHLKHIENGRPPVWERLSRKGEYPSPRSSSGSITYKDKLLIFGGVQDEECENHKIKSVFYDDLFSFDMDRKRWFKIQLKKTHASGTRRRRRKEIASVSVPKELHNDEDASAAKTEILLSEINIDESSDEDMKEEDFDREAPSSGWDLDKLRSNMYAFLDSNGNIVYENIPSIKGDDSQDANHGLEKNHRGQKDGKGIPRLESRDSPLPRINAHLAVRGHVLYIYGGILEVGDREVTLDDCWSIDMHRRDKWVCIWGGSMHKQVWKGFESDDDSYISTDRENSSRADIVDDDDDKIEDLNRHVIIEDDGDSTTTSEEKAERKAAKKAAKKEKHLIKKVMKKEKKDKVKD